MAHRDDVLSDFTVEEGASHATLKAYLQRYPEYADDLLDLFNTLTLVDLETAKQSVEVRLRISSARREIDDGLRGGSKFKLR